MNCEQINMGAYNLHLIKTKKFRSIMVDVNFRRKITEEEVTYRNLLKMVLLNSSYDYPNERELTMATEDLYDLKLISSLTRYGNFINSSFKLRFLNEKYTEKGMNSESIKLLMDVIFHPNVKDNKFDEDVVNLCKKRLHKAIKSVKDNKIKYAQNQLLKTIKDRPYSYATLGDIDILKDVNASSLYEFYKTMINNDLIDIFVVGDIDEKEIKDIFKEYVNARTYKKIDTDIIAKELVPNKKINMLNETINACQTQLVMLCSLNDLTLKERQYVAMVYAEMLGGSSSSILFNKVREENSYCYYINSYVKPYDNIMLIYSGIEGNSKDDVIKLIKDILNDIEKGKFSDDNLNNAKETIISSITSGLDYQNSIISTYYAKELVGSKDAKERIEEFKKITKEDVVAFSKKVKIHTIYTLEGGDTDEEDND